MEFDKTVNVAEIMNGVALCDEAARIVLTNCPTAEFQTTLLKVLRNYDSPKDQVREALLWTRNGDIALASKQSKRTVSYSDDKYREWKKADWKTQADRAAEHNAKVVADYMKDDDLYGILSLQEALRPPTAEEPHVPAIAAHFLQAHPAHLQKDGVFLVEVKDFKQKSWYLMPASEKISFFKRVKIFFKLIFGNY